MTLIICQRQGYFNLSMNLLALVFVFPWAVISAKTTGRFEGLPKGAVNTTSGIVIGHSSTNRTSVLEYLGIPYAQPPVLSLRFEPPVTFTSTAAYNASNYVRCFLRRIYE